MNDSEILKKAIEKAKDNGFDVEDFLKLPHPASAASDTTRCSLGINLVSINLGWHLSWGRLTSFVDHQRVIFSHDFAKAFWGDSRVCGMCGKIATPPKEKHGYYKCPDDGLCVEECATRISWQYHLQQMVLEPEPLKYLERFLNE